jgi:hypothetical protein
MQALTNAELLGLWERGRDRGPVGRALALADAALPAMPPQQCLALDIGERNAAVLALRRATFGTRLDGRLNCPGCGEPLEFELDAAALAAPASDAAEELIAGGLRFRMPNSRDLIAAARCTDAESGARALFALCCLDTPPASGWPADLVAETEAAMESRADLSDVALALTCAACGHAWTAHLDICAYFWDEIAQRAEYLLDDVHRLAIAYGWDEQHILQMSDARRAAYLERCDA